MSDGRYTTTQTTVETQEYYGYDDRPTMELSMPKLDTAYFKSLGGIMKIICICMCLMCFLFVLGGGSGLYRGANWATFVATVGLTVTTTLLALYVFHVVDSLPSVPWILMEMIFCFVWCIFFFIAACVLAAAAWQYHNTRGWAIASFFALGGMCAYGFDAYLKFLGWKRDEIAMGGDQQNPRTSQPYNV